MSVHSPTDDDRRIDSNHSRERTEVQNRSELKESAETVVIYADGSYHQQTSCAAVGYTIETNRGTTITEKSSVVAAATSMQAEAMAALQAVRQAKDYDPSYIILYSDCQPLVNAIVDKPENRSLTTEMISDELESLPFTTVKHIPRSRNERADQLASQGLRKARKRHQVRCRN